MNCLQCGAPLSESALFCSQCGKPITAQANVQQAPAESPAQATADSTRALGDPARYAGFWRRVAASILDQLILTGVSLLLLIFGLVAMGSAVLATAAAPSSRAFRLYYLLSWVVSWLYFAVLHSSSRQATFGKQALGIKVTNLAGDRISFARATGRWFATLLSTVSLGIGYIMAGFTARRQALHDIVADTLVVSRNTTRDDIAHGLAAPRVSGGVIAICVIAIGLPFGLGVLAAIAVPAYQDYAIRSQVIEGLQAAAPYKAAIAEQLARGSEYGEIDNALIGMAGDNVGQHTAGIIVEGAAVQITYGLEAHANINGTALTLVPATGEQGELVWICGRAPAPPGATPLLEDYDQYTSVDDKYLPSSCRAGSRQ